MDAYLEGLRGAGWDGRRDDVVTGYLATIVLRFIVGSVGPLLTFALDSSLNALVEQIFGYPRPQLIANWHKIDDFKEVRMACLLDVLGAD